MTTTFYTYPAMLEFTCLGDKCEDTCCQSWDIRFDKHHYSLLQSCVEKDPAQKALFEAHITLLEEGDDRNYALVNLNDNGMCPFLDTSGWCDLHRHYGVAPLSNVCAFYPRVISRYKDHYEVAGAMSCPEMARKTLLGDKAFRLVPMDPALLPRPDDFPVTRRVSSTEQDEYAAQFPLVRQAFIQLISDEAYAFDTRLFALSSLANNLSAFYYEDCANLNQGILQQELSKFSAEDGLDNIQQYFDDYTAEAPLAMIVVQAVLRLRLQQFPNESLSKLVARIFAAYATTTSEEAELYGGNIPPEALWRAYQKNARRLSERYPLLLDQVFSRYTQNCLYREWFISMPTPFVYVHMLTIRIAMLKFLVMSHPEIMALLEADTGLADEEERVQQHLIEVFYQFSRAIDHNMNFLQVVYNAIAEQDMMYFDYSLPFIKF
ncbi:MAG: flagellin lysine-N-methylase [Gammaproteobacteria bacterium]